MQFQITQIDFDFIDADGTLPIDIQDEIIDETIGTFWEADDGDDLIEEITAVAGWCINSIDYRIILK